MSKNLRSIWLVVTLAVRADPWRAVLVALMELTNGLCVATWALWLKLLADAAVERDMTLALVAAASGAGAVTMGLFAGWLGANGQTVLRERTGLALEERLARLSLGVPGLEHHERPDYQDTLALLREERGRLGDSFSAIISGLQLVVRFGATVVVLVTVHPALVLLPLFGLVLLATGRRAERLRQSAMEATAEPLRTANHLVETSTSAGPAKELLVFGLGDEFLRRHRAIWGAIDRVRTRAAIQEVALNAGGWVVLSLGYAAAAGLATWLAIEGRATAGDVPDDTQPGGPGARVRRGRRGPVLVDVGHAEVGRAAPVADGLFFECHRDRPRSNAIAETAYGGYRARGRVLRISGDR